MALAHPVLLPVHPRSPTETGLLLRSYLLLTVVWARRMMFETKCSPVRLEVELRRVWAEVDAPVAKSSGRSKRGNAKITGLATIESARSIKVDSVFPSM